MAKSFVGVVNKVIDDRTISVTITMKVLHSFYKKFVKFKKKYLVDKAATVVLKAGDEVKIRMTSPISKRKSWEAYE
jgi:ribosomal protein S17